MWQPAARCRKKGHVSLQNILRAQRKKKKEETRIRQRAGEEDKVFLHQLVPSHAQCLAPNHNTDAGEVLAVSRQTHRWGVYLWQNISEHERKPGYSPNSCFASALQISINIFSYYWIADIKRWYMQLRAASCLKLGASMILHPNCQQVSDSYPATHLECNCFKN